MPCDTAVFMEFSWNPEILSRTMRVDLNPIASQQPAFPVAGFAGQILAHPSHVCHIAVADQGRILGRFYGTTNRAVAAAGMSKRSSRLCRMVAAVLGSLAVETSFSFTTTLTG